MFRTARSLLFVICVLAAVAPCYGAILVTDSAVVTPRRGRVETRPGHAHSAVVFRVYNKENTANRFVVGCSTSGDVHTCKLVKNDTLTVAAGKYALVPVKYKAGKAGSGRVTLTASRVGRGVPKDTGSYDVGVVGAFCVTGCGGGGSTVSVWVNPGTSTVSTPTLDLFIEWCTFGSTLNASTRSISLNGSAVTSQFTYVAGGGDCDGYAYSEGTVNLQSGSNSVAASISNNAGVMGSATEFYTLVPPVTVHITPATTPAITTREVDVVIDWCSTGNLLNASSRSITVAGTNVTSQFTYTPGTSSSCLNGNYAQSTGSLDLQAGSTVVAASISNTVAQSGSDQATFTIGEVDIATANPGSSVRRDLCLTISAGPSAAYECGDLRIVHPLPAVRTMNKERAPVLIYNSDHAQPIPVVAANITPPLSGGTPSVVSAILKIGGTARTWASWAGWAAGTTRRIALSFDGSADSTGIYDYVMERVNDDGSQVYATASGKLAIVNRHSNSPFGAGWWLAGLEHLYPATMVWVGGDGSVAQYEPVTSNVWAAASVDHPDTLKWDGIHYVRYLPGGTQVKFDTAGYHVATVNRLGHTTSFTYVNGRLDRITLPTGSALALYYQFNYDLNGKLSTIWSPGENGSTRITRIWNDGTRVDSIGDPDGTTVRFTYRTPEEMGGIFGWSDAGINSRTDRRGTITKFVYGAGRLSQAIIDPNGLNIASTYLPAEVQGLDGRPATDLANVYTLLDGPRIDVADTTHFVTNGFGAPAVIRDALGGTETIRRGDYRFPGLATRFTAADGFVTDMVYNAGGNPSLMIRLNPYSKAPSQSDTTRYEYGTTGILGDFITRIVRPEKDSVVMSYMTNGNREWQQDGRGATSRTNFRYYDSGVCSGLMKAVEIQVARADSLGYDSRCNLSDSWTPMGFRTQYVRDGLGRDSVIFTPTDSAQTVGYRQQKRYFYDVMGRVIRLESFAPYRDAASPQQTAVVQTFYNAEGSQDSVWRSSVPDPLNIGTLKNWWRYDRAGRPVAEVSADATPGNPLDNPRDSLAYDLAGNVIHKVTRRGHTIDMVYDARNQLHSRHTPSVHYDSLLAGIPSRFDYEYSPLYPHYPNAGGGYTIAADDAVFEYDQVGRVKGANNSDARITRTFYPGGELKTETDSLATYDHANFTSHIYQLTYHYDRDGRRTDVVHPSQLTTGTGVTHYTYDTQSGLLTDVTDLLGNTFHYAYNGASELTDLTLPGGLGESYTYYPDGDLKNYGVGNGSTSAYAWVEDWIRFALLRYDARNKVIQEANIVGHKDTLDATYSTMGHLTASTRRVHGIGMADFFNIGTEVFSVRSVIREGFAFDALGNVSNSADSTASAAVIGNAFDNDSTIRSYSSSTGRLAEVIHHINLPSVQTDTLKYDSAGNIIFHTQLSGGAGGMFEDRASYYASDGKLRAADYRTAPIPSSYDLPVFYKSAFEEYRYDALGRRVMVRVRRWCDNDPTDRYECRLNKITRTVWDGDQELYEIQMPDNALESDADPPPLTYEPRGDGFDPNPFFGRVAYTHGLGIDRPLSVIRLGYGDLQDTTMAVRSHRAVQPFAIMPLWTYTGHADNGAFSDGGFGKCETINTYRRCVYIKWPAWYDAYSVQRMWRPAWHGSLIEEKADAAGTIYRRNRQYDPQTGQFTQEDPIGLAGGLNLYGLANGDPVNYSDPFGLCTKEDGWKDCDRMISTAESGRVFAAAVASGEWTYTQGTPDAVVDYCKRKGDCTDYVRNAVTTALGSDWASANEKSSTGMFRSGNHPGFTQIETSAARLGDVIVVGGHAGIYIGTNSKGEMWGMANNGRPSSSSRGYSDSTTGPVPFNTGWFGSGQPTFYRPIR